jgi:hypothetical protein
MIRAQFNAPLRYNSPALIEYLANVDQIVGQEPNFLQIYLSKNLMQSNPAAPMPSGPVSASHDRN